MKAQSLILVMLFLSIAFWSPANAIYKHVYNRIKVSEENTLIIYTYDYFFGMTADEKNQTVWNTIFKSFEDRYGVKIEVQFFSGARNIYLTALQEYKSGKRTADLLIGIDNIVVQEAKEEGLLEKLDFTKLENVSRLDADLIEYTDPEHYAVPYDYGPIAFVYDSERINITELKFEDFYNPEMASKLVLESPTTSTTGLAFLLWQIGVYEKLLNTDWKYWWEKVKGKVSIQKSWGDAYFSYFLNEQAGRPIVVSYLTSPVYHYICDETTRYKAMLVKYNGQWYAWYQIQAVGIVKDSPMKDIAYKFIDWLLSDEVQSLVYRHDIMLPACPENLKEIPEDVVNSMGYNLSAIKPVNALLSLDEIRNNLQEWLKEWDEVISAPEIPIYIYLLATILVLVVVVGVIYLKYYRKRRL